MASTIWLGALYGSQDEVNDVIWDIELHTRFRGDGHKAVIAKGNIIEGIEAKV